MTAVARSAVLSASNPALACWIVDSDGFLAAPTSLTFVVEDVTADTPVTRATGSGVQVATGRYAATWTVPAAEPVGRHRITWTSDTSTWSRDFDVLQSVVSQPGYITVSDMRDEGISVVRASDAHLIARINEASIFFDRCCGARWFSPRAVEWKADGSGRPVLPIEHPIIGIDSVSLFNEGVIDPSYFKVYNRHLAGLTAPDDRANPKLEFYVTQPGLQGPLQPLAYPYPISAAWAQAKPWTKGTQNVTVSGVFGYTDPDGSPEGCTPELVKRAVKLLVLRNLPAMGRATDRLDAINRHRIERERTREQSYDLTPMRLGAFTTDPEIDSIIEMFSKPPGMWAV